MQYVEQDYNIPKGGDELPTYDDLAAQGGPNSRWLSISIRSISIQSYMNCQIWSLERVDREAVGCSILLALHT
jgi:hypothetical protein